MGLPATRNTDYAANSIPKIKAADLNALQDLWVLLTSGTSTLFATPLSWKQLIVDGVGNVATALAAGVVAKITGGALQIEGSSSDTAPILVTNNAPTDERRLWARMYLSASVYLRIYFLKTNFGLEITTNAQWDHASALWIQDDAGASSRYRFNLNGTYPFAAQYNPGGASFAEGAWVNSLTITGSDSSLTTSGHYDATGTAPTIAIGAAANNGGGDGTVAVVAGSNDVRGRFSVLTGAAVDTSTSAIVCTVTFNKAFPSSPEVLIRPTNAATAELPRQPYVDSTTTTFTVKIPATGDLATTTTYGWNFHVLG